MKFKLRSDLLTCCPLTPGPWSCEKIDLAFDWFRNSPLKKGAAPKGAGVVLIFEGSSKMLTPALAIAIH